MSPLWTEGDIEISRTRDAGSCGNRSLARRLSQIPSEDESWLDGWAAPKAGRGPGGERRGAKR